MRQHASVCYMLKNIVLHRQQHNKPCASQLCIATDSDAMQTLVIALGAGLGIWGVINLLEGYGNDNPGAKSQGMKQLMAGGGVALIGMILVPLLKGLFG